MPKTKIRASTAKNSGFGRALIRTQRRKVGLNVANYDKKNPEFRDTGSSNLKSVIEMNTLDEFMSHADLAKRDFGTKRGKLLISGGMSLDAEAEAANENNISGDDESVEDDDDLDENIDEIASVEPEEVVDIRLLSFPKKPAWTEGMSAEAYAHLENETFYQWRRQLSKIESNLSGTDGITPYERNINIWREFWHVTDRSDLLIQILDSRDPLFYFIDLSSINKPMKILMNKCELLTSRQIELWREYWARQGCEVIFYSALLVLNKSDESYRDVLLTSLANYNHVGFCGYPNVGKSSVIKSLLSSSSTSLPSISSHPGHTKHLNSYLINHAGLSLNQLEVIDCPGLVIPKTCQDGTITLLLHNSSSINTSRVVVPASDYISKLIANPASFIGLYHTDNLNDYCMNRGFVCGKLNQADLNKGAKNWIDDYINGKLLYNHPPPDADDGTRREFLNETVLRMAELHPSTFVQQAIIHDDDVPYANTDLGLGDGDEEEESRHVKVKRNDKKNKKLWGKAKRWAETHESV